MSYGIELGNLLTISERQTPLPSLISVTAGSLSSALDTSYFQPFVEVPALPQGRFVGFELKVGATFYGVVPGPVEGRRRLLTNMATNYAIIGPAPAHQGAGIEIRNSSNTLVLSDNSAVWPCFYSNLISSSAFSGSVSVAASKRLFVFGISCAITSVNGTTFYYSGLSRTATEVNLIMSSRKMQKWFSQGLLNYGHRPLQVEMYEIMNLPA